MKQDNHSYYTACNLWVSFLFFPTSHPKLPLAGTRAISLCKSTGEKIHMQPHNFFHNMQGKTLLELVTKAAHWPGGFASSKRELKVGGWCPCRETGRHSMALIQQGVSRCSPKYCALTVWLANYL